LVSSRELATREIAYEIERLLHWKFRARRTRGEWFRVPVGEAKSALRGARPVKRTPLEASQMIAAIFDRQREEPDMLQT